MVHFYLRFRDVEFSERVLGLANRPGMCRYGTSCALTRVSIWSNTTQRTILLSPPCSPVCHVLVSGVVPICNSYQEFFHVEISRALFFYYCQQLPHRYCCEIPTLPRCLSSVLTWRYQSRQYHLISRYIAAYSVVQKTESQFYFWDNFGISAPILTIVSLSQAEFYGA